MLVLSILWVIDEYINQRENQFYAWIVFAAIFGGLSGFYISKYQINDYLKILLPTIVSMLGTIWLLSNGYLNLRAESLAKGIRELENLKQSLVVERDSLNRLILTYEEELKGFPDQVKELAKAKILNRKIESENRRLKGIFESESHLVLFEHLLKTNFENQISSDNYESRIKVLDKNYQELDSEDINVFIPAETMQSVYFDSSTCRF